MRLTMKERKTVTKALAREYQRARKKDKGALLDQFTAATGYSRPYAAWLLRNHGKRVEIRPGVVLEGSVRASPKSRPRARKYGPELLKPLKKVWATMDYICGKRLAPVMPEIVDCLIRHDELRVSRAVADKLKTMSAATMDRLLAAERKKLALKGRSRTKPGTLLKSQIPVRTFADWNEKAPGFIEMDLVAHEGGSSHGEFCHTLDITDIHTCWSELIAVPSKAQCRVFDAMKEVRTRLPFPLLGVDSDNGSEFINHEMVRYCHQEELSFTRSRPGRKNDNCFVEQKNWSIVRRFCGYARFEGEEACRELNVLYEDLRLYINHFTPSVKLVEKVRNGARVTKRYDLAQTPYQRVMACPQISSAVKSRLRKEHAALNPAALKRGLEASQKRLLKQAIRLRGGPAVPHKPGESHPWRASACERKKA